MNNRFRIILLTMVAGLFLLSAFSQWPTFVSASSLPSDSSAGCTAFPIAVQEGSRSVTAPGTGTNPYPAEFEFDYPFPPPVYSDFAAHTPDTPLLQASAGDVFRLYQGSNAGDFGWLVWNEYVNASAATLANSLTWPGNTYDYESIASGQTPPGFSHPVYGYIEAGDPTDTEMHINDWVAASTGSVNAADVQAALNDLIDNGRVLRLPVWDEAEGQDAHGRFHISRFALFRLVGYNLAQSQGNSWLLLEFMGVDESCGQIGSPPTGVPVLHIKAVSRTDDLLVGWMPNRFLEADAYRLLKADEETLFEEVAVTSDNKYSDSEVEAGTTYCYQVQALGENMDVIVASEIVCAAKEP